MAHQPPAARSTLDVALWLQARSNSAGDRLLQRKLHLLLNLAQTLYAADHAGNRPMPATFLASETGPLEPNSHQLFAEGTPLIVPGKINSPAESFLHEVWARFGRQSVAEIERFLRRDGAWSVALKEGAPAKLRCARSWRCTRGRGPLVHPQRGRPPPGRAVPPKNTRRCAVNARPNGFLASPAIPPHAFAPRTRRHQTGKAAGFALSFQLQKQRPPEQRRQTKRGGQPILRPGAVPTGAETPIKPARRARR